MEETDREGISNERALLTKRELLLIDNVRFVL